MSKLKEINGRYYQECDVVMLPSNEKVEVYTKNKNVLCIDSQTSILRDNLTLVSYPNRYRMKPQHLYFLNNEKIKEGDWFMNRQYMIEEGKEEYAIWRCGDVTPNSNPKKIIATTDLSLGLPQPSPQFIQAYIKAYNENKPITKVLVEMQKFLITDGYFSLITQDSYRNDPKNHTFELKVNPNNEVTIKKIKDNYTRDEVCNLLNLYRIYTWENGSTANDLNKWIKENL